MGINVLKISAAINFIKISAVIAVLLLPITVMAQSALPSPGATARYSAQIDFRKAYLSGVCIMRNDNDTIKGSMMNEFGVSAISFVYLPQRNRVKLTSVIAQIDKWYIRMTLRRDLRALMHAMERGTTTYTNPRQNIVYNLTEMK